MGFVNHINRKIEHFIECLIDNRVSLTIWTVIIAAIIFASSCLILNVGSVEFNGRLKDFNQTDNAPGFNVFEATSKKLHETNVKQAALKNIPPAPDKVFVEAKQVGYGSAPNWAFYSIILAPAIVFFAIGTLQSFNSTLSNMCERGMVRDRNFKRIEYNYIKDKWQRHIYQNRLMFIVIVCAVMFFMMGDWWKVVGHPLLYPETVTNLLNDSQMEYDWSVAWLYEGSDVNRIALFIFGFVAYMLFAALVPALAVSVTLCTIFFMSFLTTARTEEGQMHFVAVPTESAKDRHFGFKVFTDLFHNFLIMSLTLITALWVMAMQNIYLRDPESGNIIEFWMGQTSQHKGLLNGDLSFNMLWAWLVQPGENFVENIQVYYAFVLLPFVCIFAVTLCWVVLRTRAMRAQELSIKNVDKLAAEFNISKDLLQDRLSNEMEIWPVGWIKSRHLLYLMVFLGLSLVCYRIIILPVLVLGTISIFGMMKNIVLGK